MVLDAILANTLYELSFHQKKFLMTIYCFFCFVVIVVAVVVVVAFLF